jgi:hypothetical protein
MKKLLQICLIAILVCVLFQASADGTGMPASQTDLVASHNFSVTNASAESAHVSACWIRIKSVGCVLPNVGWNS